MKTRVAVTLRAPDEVVEIDVEHLMDEDPTDLTEDDIDRARLKAGVSSSWDAVDVEKVSE